MAETSKEGILNLHDNAKQLVFCANEKRKSDMFNDINIQVGNEKFPCNKMVLSCYSKYFDTMFQTEMQERYQDTVELKGFEAIYVKMLIDYIYGENIVVDEKNVFPVLAASDYMQLYSSVKEFCIEFLKRNLIIRYCLDVFGAYNLHMLKLPLDQNSRFLT